MPPSPRNATPNVEEADAEKEEHVIDAADGESGKRDGGFAAAHADAFDGDVAGAVVAITNLHRIHQAHLATPHPMEETGRWQIPQPMQETMLAAQETV